MAMQYIRFMMPTADQSHTANWNEMNLSASSSVTINFSCRHVVSQVKIKAKFIVVFSLITLYLNQWLPRACPPSWTSSHSLSYKNLVHGTWALLLLLNGPIRFDTWARLLLHLKSPAFAMRVAFADAWTISPWFIIASTKIVIICIKAIYLI